jgi:hypothetical protein
VSPRSLLISAAALLALTATASPAGAAPRVDPDLWATVNLCNPTDHPGAMGVRISMPPRYRGEKQWMRIRVQWFDLASSQWKMVRAGADTGWKRIGVGRQLAQAGATFAFRPPSAGRWLLLRGVVDFQWRKRGRMTKTARTTTLAGHDDQRDPQLSYSNRGCAMYTPPAAT